jgi:CheY-like chemotaxis protein
MFRPNFSTKGKAGRGLGLPIVSTILQGNRAALWIESTPGSGTTVTVAWPTSEPIRGETGAGGVRDATEVLHTTVYAELLRGLRILVVDDLPDVAEVLADMLEAAGATVVATFHPEEAAEALSEAPDVWSALVTDLHMSGMDGRALARHAGGLAPAIPSVLVTARPDALGEGRASEFAAVLSKPVTAAQLVRAVRDAADLKAAER